MSQKSAWTIANYPSEIFREIVTHIEYDYQTLKNLCLTASSFNAMAQKALFSDTKIRGQLAVNPVDTIDLFKTQTKRIKNLYDIVQSREELGLLVKTLDFDFGQFTLPTPEAVAQAAYLLSKFERVERATLSHHKSYTIFTVSGVSSFGSDSPLRGGILSFLQRPSLVQVIFDDFDQLSPAHFLHLGPSVKQLALTGHTFFPYKEIEGFDMKAQDILEGYGPNPCEQPPFRNKVFIETLEVEIVSSAMWHVLDRMMDSPFCAMDISRVKTMTVRSERSQQEYTDVVGLLYDRAKDSLKCLDTFNGHGFLFPSNKLSSFMKLQVFKAFLGAHEDGEPKLDRFLTFLEDGTSADHSPLPLRVVDLIIMIRYGTFREEVERAVWGRVAEIFCGERFASLEKVALFVAHENLRGVVRSPGDVAKNAEVWSSGYKEAMKALGDKGMLQVTVVPLK